MSRRLLNPNSLTAEPNAEDIRRALVDIWYLVSEVPVSAGKDYTTSGAVSFERIVGTNDIPITIKLHERAADGDQVWIKRQNALITVEGNGNTIDGETSWTLDNKYDDIMVMYTDAGGEWSIMASLSIPLDSEGSVRTSDSQLNDAIAELTADIKLLNERFEEAYETGIIKEDI